MFPWKVVSVTWCIPVCNFINDQSSSIPKLIENIAGLQDKSDTLPPNYQDDEVSLCISGRLSPSPSPTPSPPPSLRSSTSRKIRSNLHYLLYHPRHSVVKTTGSYVGRWTFVQLTIVFIYCVSFGRLTPSYQDDEFCQHEGHMLKFWTPSNSEVKEF